MPARYRSLLDRFWEKVDASAGPDGCHPWRGAVTINRNGKDGYGVIQTGGRGSPQVKAHRFALVYASGEDPPDREAGHDPTCTTTLCCNERHLRWVTREENEADKGKKLSDRERIAAALDRVLADPEYAGVVMDGAGGAEHVAH